MMKYRIKEIENNFTYDDIYNTVEEAMEQIEAYMADDGDNRNITYTIVEA